MKRLLFFLGLLGINCVYLNAQSGNNNHLIGQQRLKAKRAAQLDGYRQLEEQIKNLKVNSHATLSDLLLENPQIETELKAFLKGTRVIDTRYFNDGVCEVDMEITREALVAELVRLIEFYFPLNNNTSETSQKFQASFFHENYPYQTLRVTGTGSPHSRIQSENMNDFYLQEENERLLTALSQLQQELQELKTLQAQHVSLQEEKQLLLQENETLKREMRSLSSLLQKEQDFFKKSSKQYEERLYHSQAEIRELLENQERSAKKAQELLQEVEFWQLEYNELKKAQTPSEFLTEFSQKTKENLKINSPPQEEALHSQNFELQSLQKEKFFLEKELKKNQEEKEKLQEQLTFAQNRFSDSFKNWCFEKTLWPTEKNSWTFVSSWDQMRVYHTAKAEAQRQLARDLKKLPLNPTTSLADLLMENHEIEVAFNHFLYRLEVFEVHYYPDLTCEVLLEVSLKELWEALKK
jgi:hypothetical protein